MGLIEQSTGQATNGLIAMSVLFGIATVVSVRLRHGQEAQRANESALGYGTKSTTDPAQRVNPSDIR